MTEVTRPSGRPVDALRTLRLTRDYTKHAEGSVLIECGDTKVICTASIEEKVPGFLKGKGQGWLTAEYGMLPRSTHSRMDREAAKGKQSGRTQEIQRLIGRSLRAAFDLEAFGERTLHLDCDVIQADGGTRCASITGGYIALELAFNKLMADGLLKSTPLIDSIAAISVGVVGGESLLDLPYVAAEVAEAPVRAAILGVWRARCEAGLRLAVGRRLGLVDGRGCLRGHLRRDGPELV